MKELTKEEIESIKGEAGFYSSELYVMGDRSTYAYKGYIAGATVHAERGNILKSAMIKIYRSTEHIKDDSFIDAIRETIAQALNNHNKK